MVVIANGAIINETLEADVAEPARVQTITLR
jgi:hypothetical protein